MRNTKFTIILISLLALFYNAQNLRSVLQAQDNDIRILSVVWSHDGSKIAAVGVRAGTSNGYIFVLDAVTGETLYRLENPYGGFSSAVWSPDDRHIAVGGYDQDARVIEFQSREIVATLSGHRWVVDSVDWSADGTRLVTSSSGDQQVILWDTATYTEIRQLEIGDPWAVAFSPDDQYIAVGSASGLWMLPNDLVLVGGRLLDQYRKANGNLGAVAWNHDGTQIAFGNQTFQPTTGTRPNPQVTVVDAANNAIITNFEIPDNLELPDNNGIYSLTWSSDDTLIATYSLDGTVGVWDANTGNEVQLFSGHAGYIVRSLGFSPYGGRLAYGISIPGNMESSTANQTQSLANSGIQIVVPAPSFEQLVAIAELCVRDSATRSSEVNNLTRQAPAALDDLPAFIAQIEALPDEAIPPACRADLLAVASALGE